jgi:endonuclease/exonuclease/phosphatase family metal-dependent hydrolase
VRIRVVSWNVDSRPTGLLDAKIELLRRLEPDIALLQEINRPVYRALLPHPSAHERLHRTQRLFAWGALSTDLARPRGSESRLGCAVLGAVPGTALLDAHVLDRVPFDVREPALPGFMWRTVATRVALSTGELITACSFHGRQGTGSPGAALQRPFHAGIAQWLATVPGPAVFGIDAGQPAPGAADPLLGAEPGHELEDALRADPERRRAAAHDHLWASRDLKVLDVQCLAEDAAAAGSDHAVLVAELELGSS